MYATWCCVRRDCFHQNRALYTKYVTIATETRLRAQNQFFLFCLFFFFVGRNLLLHMVMLEKVTDQGFLAFWPFENE